MSKLLNVAIEYAFWLKLVDTLPIYLRIKIHKLSDWWEKQRAYDLE